MKETGKVTFQPWKSTTSLPGYNQAGNWYLTNNVTLDNYWEPKNGTVLCLNGYSITVNKDTESQNANAAIVVGENISFTLADCKGERGEYGKITHGTDTDGNKYPGGGVRLYRGTFTMYGGNITDNVMHYMEYSGGGVRVVSGTFTMYGGEITNNKVTNGGEYSDGGSDDGGNGGGVCVSGGTFTMYDGTISGNIARRNGGGVYAPGGTFIMEGGTISGNEAKCISDLYSGGGGVYLKNGRFTMKAGTISNNRSTCTESGYTGGGVYVWVSSSGKNYFTMEGGTISGNEANGAGGGVDVCAKGSGSSGEGESVFIMKGGTISDNEAIEQGNAYNLGQGGGVFVYAYGTFTMQDGSITGNNAGKYGGGVYAYGKFTMSGGTIGGTGESKANTAGESGGGVYVDKYGGFIVSGAPTVNGNKDKDGNANNVHLSDGKTIAISDALTGDNDSIGVTLGSWPTKSTINIATGANLTADDAEKFISDKEDYTISVNSSGDKLVLAKQSNPAVGHTHCLCGLSGVAGTPAHDHDATIQWTGVSDLSSITKDGYYYLTDNVVYTKGAHWSLGLQGESRTIQLCLNGHKIIGAEGSYVIYNYNSCKLVLTDCNVAGTGAVTHENTTGGGVLNKGTFTLWNGKITGNSAGTGAGVSNEGTFYMYGGSITGNSADYGGGVWSNNRFTMAGGTIVNNNANYYGGGVYVGGTFTVSGAAKITNNKVNGTANNVYLPVANTTLVGVIGALTDGAEIGVTPKEWPEGDGKTAIAAGKEHATSETCYTIEDSDKACFKSDNSDYEISLVSNVLVLTKKGGSTTTEKQDQAALTLAADKSTLAVGETLTLTVTGGTGTGAVTYTVSDTEKATISGKTLTAKKAGTITVTATKAGDETYNTIDSNTITITIAEKSADPTPSTPSSSGSSSSGPRIIKTETRTAPDGSVTKTETWSDGTVTETTTGKDGSTTKTTTKKDGSSVTESKAADGTTGTVKTDKNGRTEAAAKVSNKAVEDAKKSGEAVKVPTEVKAGENSDSAPTVKVELPKNAGETKIEIPVSDVNSGTVAVIVHPDGTEEIVKDSKPTEDGIQLVVDGSATIKIIDNSKDFIDTRDHWSRDEVNFVVARELFNGVGNDLFGVDQPMTRGMVNTVLARLAGVDTTPSAGQKWYEVGTAWAKANGITDGTNPEASVTREQLATLLYRFYGSPAVSGTLSFADAGAVSDYAQNALLWATQNGILNGVGNNRVAPGADAQRAQVAAMMARYLKNAG